MLVKPKELIHQIMTLLIGSFIMTFTFHRYYSNFIDRQYNASGWVYYYVFLFFMTAVSFFCSLAAMRRVLLDKRSNQGRLLQIAKRNSEQSFLKSPRPQSASPEAAKDTMIERQVTSVHKVISRSIKGNTDSFSKVVIRSLLYPLSKCHFCMNELFQTPLLFFCRVGVVAPILGMLR